MPGRWTGWHPLNEDYVRREEGHGIYAIRLVSPDGRRVRVPRLGGEDPEGIFYIGRSGRSTARGRALRNRLQAFLSGQEWSGESFNVMESKLYDILGRFNLEYRVMRLTDEEIEEKARQQILRYLRRFGELPPFNSVATEGGR